MTPGKNEDFPSSLKGDELRNSFLYVNLIPPPNPVRKALVNHDHLSKKSLSVISQYSVYADAAAAADEAAENNNPPGTPLQLLKP